MPEPDQSQMIQDLQALRDRLWMQERELCASYDAAIALAQARREATELTLALLATPEAP